MEKPHTVHCDSNCQTIYFNNENGVYTHSFSKWPLLSGP